MTFRVRMSVERHDGENQYGHEKWHSLCFFDVEVDPSVALTVFQSALSNLSKPSVVWVHADD